MPRRSERSSPTRSRPVARHPGTAPSSSRRLLEAHPRLLLAALGIVAFRGRPLLQAAAALPYLDCYVDWRQLARPRGGARIALNLTGRVTLDALELAVTARGAIAERTLIL